MRPARSLTLSPQRLSKNVLHIRNYRLPAGTYPIGDPRSIYDTRVKYLWQPDAGSNVEERARVALQTAAQAAFGFPSTTEVKEECLKLFFVPYWIVRVALYSAVNHATVKRQLTEGRIAMDVTFSLSGSSNNALRNLHFLTPTTPMLNLQAASTPPQERFVYVPFSEAPPLHWRMFFQTMSEDKHVMLAKNLRLKPQPLQCNIAAQPCLEPLALGEYTYQNQRLTAAYCPRAGETEVKIFRRGNWTHETEPVGPLRVGMSIAWSTDDPLGEDKDRYKSLEETLQNKAKDWLRAARVGGGSTALTPSVWASAAVGDEGLESVRSWQKAKIDLYSEGYEVQ
ncbi:hypothetical protein M408DRAFT_19031 [Serendipita vermifera MAFF 305830]|uniref:Uncharacterized protein n=1 Tax=Serendipita vermifera MAFF 305830 TaxID=933852 RepID=A0A0C3BB87_SERVB|nr:hypothetical protein M408DRAFT_19031 [Serendipita vermifera MAFF 305830]